jgi:hypothetical protein
MRRRGTQQPLNETGFAKSPLNRSGDKYGGNDVSVRFDSRLSRLSEWLFGEAMFEVTPPLLFRSFGHDFEDCRMR